MGIRFVIEQLRSVPGRMWALYAVCYALIGLLNQRLGQFWAIAEFRHDWQILTCYVLYLVPWSLAVRALRPLDQYLWGLLCLSLLELPGYALGTSIAHPGNAIDRLLGERNFALVMVVGFAALLPAGNALMAALARLLFRAATPAASGPASGGS
jgi:hypothetical protein